MENYIVIGYDKNSRTKSSTLGLFEVHVEKGETVKDVQDKVAADLAEERLDTVIYTVVLESEYRQIWSDRLAYFFGGRK